MGIWTGCFRALGTLAPNAIVHLGTHLFKHPLCWARNRISPGQVSVLPVDSEEVSPDESRASNGIPADGNESTGSNNNAQPTEPHLSGSTGLTSNLDDEDDIETPDTCALDWRIVVFGEPRGLDFNRLKPDIRVWDMEEVTIEDRKINSDATSAIPKDENGWLGLEEEILIKQDPARIPLRFPTEFRDASMPFVRKYRIWRPAGLPEFQSWRRYR